MSGDTARGKAPLPEMAAVGGRRAQRKALPRVVNVGGVYGCGDGIRRCGLLKTPCMSVRNTHRDIYLLLNFGSLSMSHSAICTAFRAAPFLIWSLTIQKVMPLGLARSLRTRPT